MNKSYLIQNTTKAQREKIVNDGISISVLDASEPSTMAYTHIQNYIDGKCELTDVKHAIIKHYRGKINA
jgi:hypothetical protein